MTTPNIIQTWIKNPLPPGLLQQLNKVAQRPGVTALAVMADAHSGPELPNGLAVACLDRVYPDLAGSDLGCGYSALAFQGRVSNLPNNFGPILMTGLLAAIPTLCHRRPVIPTWNDEIHPEQLSHPSLKKMAEREGMIQMGTLGRGNHFLELSRDAQGRLWTIVHSGSRAMGPAICRKHRQGAGPDGFFFLDTKEAQTFFSDHDWALRWALANRSRMLNRVADLMEGLFRILPEPTSWIDSPHNLTRVEPRVPEEGRQAKFQVVHRKSVSPATNGEIGILAGSMASGCWVMRGAGNSQALNSAAHGAGRTFSRSQAFSTIQTKRLLSDMKGIYFRQEWMAKLKDEAPVAYREPLKILSAQADLASPINYLKPLLNDKRI